MFRVPANPENPTFDQTFKVSFIGWLTSKAPDRHEWRRRRDIAARTAGANQHARARAWEQRQQQR